MADVNISKYSTQIVREGSKPAAPGFVVSEGQDPVNPPGTNNYVPYTGATANVELGEYGLESGFVTLDTTPTNTPADQGTIYWDDSRSTAALIMNGTLQHIGQDTFFYVKNSTGSNIAKGTAVRFAGTDGASGHLLIAPFLANGTYPSNYFMGVTAEAIANGSFGQVMHFGELQGVNTSGYTAGDLLYASTSVAGAFQTTAPVAPNNIVLVAAAINSTNNGTILVRPTYGSNINQDEGVKIVSPTTGDLLQLQAGGLWENKTKAQILGGTSSQFVKGDGSLDSTSYQPLLTNPVTGTGTTNYLPKFTGSTTIGNSVIADNASEINIPKRIFLNSGSESIFLTPNLSSASNRIEGSSGVPLEITTGGSSLKFAAGGTTAQFTLASSGAATFTGSVTASSIIKSGGTSTQYLMADGSVSTLTNPITGTGTTNYLPKFTGSTTIGNSIVFDNGSAVGIGGTNTDSLLTINGTAGTSHQRFREGSTTIGFVGGANGLITGQNGKLVVRSESGLVFSSQGNSPDVLITSGNLLVGTTTDAGYKLDVNGTFRASSGEFINGGQDGSLGSVVRISTTNTNAGSRNWAIVNTWDNYGDLTFRVSNAQGGNALSAGATRMVLLANGNVGIGTTSPYANLDLGATGANNIILRNTTSAYNLGYIGNAGGRISIGFSDSNSSLVVLPYLSVLSSGNVGIGTSSPGSPLHVVNSSNGFIYRFSGGTSSAITGGIFAEIGRNFASIGTTSNHGFNIFTNDLDRLAITSGGNVLIGTTTDNGAKLQLFNSGTATQLIITGGDTSNQRLEVTDGTVTNRFGIFGRTNGDAGVIGTQTNHPLVFNTNNTERMRITSGGNVGIGTTSPNVNLEVAAPNSLGSFAKFRLNSPYYNHWEFINNSALEINRGGLTHLTISDLGNVLIGTTTDAGYKLDVNGTGRFSGNLRIEKSTPLFVLNDTSGSGAQIGSFGGNLNLIDNATGTKGVVINLSTGAATFSSLGTGTVYSNGGTLTNTNPSDLNLKTNVEPINYGLDEILKLNPVSFHWKNDTINQGKQYGFIAQEVQKIMPDLVKQGEYLGLDKEAIFTTLVKAIQELNEKIK